MFVWYMFPLRTLANPESSDRSYASSSSSSCFDVEEGEEKDDSPIPHIRDLLIFQSVSFTRELRVL